MFYFSERALNEVCDTRLSTDSEATNGSVVGKWFSIGRSRSLSVKPGSNDQVDFVLKKIRQLHRKIARNLWKLDRPGSLFDVKVVNLHVGVMPFARFGGFGELTRNEKIRAFWGETKMFQKDAMHSQVELILVGSLDNVVNGSWKTEEENELKIGHGYPSDPSHLGEYLSWELQLEDNEAVQEEIKRTDLASEPGDEALAVSQFTERAFRTRIRHNGYATSWERRIPFAEARVVGIIRDIWRSKKEDQIVILARPILIQDTT